MMHSYHVLHLDKDVFFSVTGLRRKTLSTSHMSRTNDHLVTSPVALPLSYRRLMGAKATKQG